MMSINRIIKNVFSSWASLIVTVLITFFVSPIIVHNLGKETYGIWVIIVSVTGYFTILDFGINAAIVKYISEYFSKNDEIGIRTIFSSSMFVFMIVAIAIVVIGFFIGYNFKNFLEIKTLTYKVAAIAFGVIVIDIAISMIFSVFSGTFTALQEFVALNAISISVTIIKNTTLVIFLLNGYGLLSIAYIQLATSIVRCIAQYFYLRARYPEIYFEVKSINSDTFKVIYNYSIYSFIIAIALKILFYTDSIVIGKIINTESVAYYAIPSSLLDYIEKFVWAMIAVLVPVISGNDAIGQYNDNQKIYLIGTRYSILISAPILITLYFVGPDFIALWMGNDFRIYSSGVLRILTVGYGIAFSQLTAQALLKGIAKHKILALILFLEAGINLFISIFLAPKYGIEGVALGTTLPLVTASMILIVYTCKCAKINIWYYLLDSYIRPSLSIIITIIVMFYGAQKSDSYSMIIIQSSFAFILFFSISIPTCIEKNHLKLIKNRFF